MILQVLSQAAILSLGVSAWGQTSASFDSTGGAPAVHPYHVVEQVVQQREAEEGQQEVAAQAVPGQAPEEQGKESETWEQKKLREIWEGGPEAAKKLTAEEREKLKKSVKESLDSLKSGEAERELKKKLKAGLDALVRSGDLDKEEAKELYEETLVMFQQVVQQLTSVLETVLGHLKAVEAGSK